MPASLKRPRALLDVSRLSHLGVGPADRRCNGSGAGGRREAVGQPQIGTVCQHQSPA